MRRSAAASRAALSSGPPTGEGDEKVEEQRSDEIANEDDCEQRRRCELPCPLCCDPSDSESKLRPLFRMAVPFCSGLRWMLEQRLDPTSWKGTWS